MVKKSSLNSGVHRCSAWCLGPLAFHSQSKGQCICLTEQGRCAERASDTFKNGLLFSCRSVQVQERVRLRIDKHQLNWAGALRVGFTTVPPSARAGELPCMAIPCLTKVPGHWAAIVEDSLVRTGAVLEFWVSDSGSLNVLINNSVQKKLLTGVDISRPLWAMIDVYGQTCGITLLGSVKKKLFRTRKSCPPPECEDVTPSAPTFEPCRVNPLMDTRTTAGEDCVVCLSKEARIIVKPCGHRCLCSTCAIRFLEEFGTCPLCRQIILSGVIAAE